MQGCAATGVENGVCVGPTQSVMSPLSPPYVGDRALFRTASMPIRPATVHAPNKVAVSGMRTTTLSTSRPGIQAYKGKSLCAVLEWTVGASTPHGVRAMHLS